MGQPRRATVEIWNRPKCEAGAQRLKVVKDRLSLKMRYAANLESTLELLIRIGNPAREHLKSQRVLRVVEKRFADSVITEWLIEDVEDDTDTGRTTVFARDLGVILGETGSIHEVGSNGLPAFDFNHPDQTLTEVWNARVQPWLNSQGKSWITLGTVSSTLKLDNLPVNDNTPLEVAHALRSHERVNAKLRFRRNGDTGYFVDFVDRLTTKVVDLRSRKNLLGLRRTERGAEHYPLLSPRGDVLPDGQLSTIRNAVLRVKALNVSGSNRIQVEDPEAPDKPVIVIEDQFNGRFTWRWEKGGDHEVLDTLVATQELVLVSSASFAVGDLLELRLTAGTIEIFDLYGAARGSPTFVRPMRVTNVNGGTRVVTIDEPWTSGPPDAHSRDDFYNGWRARVYSFVSNPTVVLWTSSTRILQVNSVSGIQVGDLCFATNSVAVTSSPPWNFTEVARVESINAGANEVTLQQYAWGGSLGSTDFSAPNLVSFWHPFLVTEIEDASDNSSSTTGTYTLASVASVANGNLIEVFRTANGQPNLNLVSPAAVSAARSRVGRYSVPGVLGLRNYAPNGLLRNFSNGVNAAPDGGYTLGALVSPFGLKDTTVYETAGASLILRPPTQTTVVGSHSATDTTLNVVSTNDMVEDMVLRINAGGGSQEDVTIDAILGPTSVQLTAGLANAHSNGESVRSRAADGTFPTNRQAQTYAIESRFWAAPLVTGNDIVQLKVRVRGEGITGTNQNIRVRLFTRAGSLDLTSTTLGEWHTLGVNAIVAPGDVVQFSVAINNPSGNAVPALANLRVDAWMLAVNGFDEMPFIEYAGSNRLLQAGNDRLLLVQSALRAFSARIVDLFGLDTMRWPHLELLVDADVMLAERLTNTLARGIRAQTVDVNVDSPGSSQINVDAEEFRLTERLAAATVSVPIIATTAAGVATVQSQTTPVRVDFGERPRRSIVRREEG